MDPLRPVPIGQKLALARQLRRNPTPAERHAWALLRNRRLLGLKFRRQHVLHGFVVDFYCPAAKLVIELEGYPHDGAERSDYDAARAAWLRSAGYRVIRVRNREVSRGRLEELVGALLRPLSPLSRRGGGDRG